MYALVARFELHDQASAQAFDRLVEATAQGILAKEPGTLVYVTHQVADAPLARVFYEVYRDQEAFEEHGRQPHTIHFLTERQRYVLSARVEFIKPITSKGLPADD
ncbi:MAG: putative quinol monooxygenase [Pseudonocardiaceae bacterium]